MLLRVLQARLGAQRRCVHIPHAAFGADDMSGWILGLLGEPPGEAPDETLLELSERLEEDGSALALLVDEAASLPPDAAARLAALARVAHPGASLVLAGVEDARMPAVRAALGRELLLIHFDEPMSRDECGHYAQSLLARDLRPARREIELDSAALDWLFHASEGNPAAMDELVEQRAWEGRPRETAPWRTE
jgi:hypothetical protein